MTPQHSRDYRASIDSNDGLIDYLRDEVRLSPALISRLLDMADLAKEGERATEYRNLALEHEQRAARLMTENAKLVAQVYDLRFELETEQRACHDLEKQLQERA